LRFVEKRRQAFAVVFGIEKSKRGTQFLLAERNIVLQAAHPLLVPAGDQRRASANAAGTRVGLGNHFGIGDDTGHQAFGQGLGGAENAAFEQDFEHRRRSGQTQQTFHLAGIHREAELVDRRSEA
jgi:hypothetical protein